ncbi:TPA: ion channel [Clostridium perfringens]
MVCLVGSASPSAFTNAQGKFDLCYYTIITFSTIGYGDIYSSQYIFSKSNFYFNFSNKYSLYKCIFN